MRQMTLLDHVCQYLLPKEIHKSKGTGLVCIEMPPDHWFLPHRKVLAPWICGNMEQWLFTNFRRPVTLTDAQQPRTDILVLGSHHIGHRVMRMVVTDTSLHATHRQLDDGLPHPMVG